MSRKYYIPDTTNDDPKPNNYHWTNLSILLGNKLLKCAAKNAYNKYLMDNNLNVSYNKMNNWINEIKANVHANDDYVYLSDIIDKKASVSFSLGNHILTLLKEDDVLLELSSFTDNKGKINRFSYA